MTEEDWNPEQAGAELKALFDEADKICSKPIYQEAASADELETPSASPSQPTEVNESSGINQS